MSVETTSFFAQAIQHHLELKQQNATLERNMPLDVYKSDDPFENHPLFKTEEQARLEETLDGSESAVAAHVHTLTWPGEEKASRRGRRLAARRSRGQPLGSRVARFRLGRLTRPEVLRTSAREDQLWKGTRRVRRSEVAELSQ